MKIIKSYKKIILGIFCFLMAFGQCSYAIIERFSVPDKPGYYLVNDLQLSLEE
jgi:hypothetical protein